MSIVLARSVAFTPTKTIARTVFTKTSFSPTAKAFQVQTRNLRSLSDLAGPITSQSEAAKKTQAENKMSSPGATAAAATTSASSPASAPAAAPSSAKKVPKKQSLVLTLSCPDQRGIVHTVTGWLASRSFDIRDSAQYGDPDTGKFFMRVHAEGPDNRNENVEALRREFGRDVGQLMKMDFSVEDEIEKPKTLLMVSKIGHCIHDLLYRYSTGTLPVEIPLIVSNHPNFEALAKLHNIPFYHLPIDTAAGKTKEWQESEILKLIDTYKIDLVVLARYMQILSPGLCEKMSGKIINIHHSFLPSFKGAKPYHQAHTRGVKLIGATAHLVTSALDEGPIIEQDVERIDHSYTPEEMVKKGAEIEQRVLARAVIWKAERRILENGPKTVVFN